MGVAYFKTNEIRIKLKFYQNNGYLILLGKKQYCKNFYEIK